MKRALIWGTVVLASAAIGAAGGYILSSSTSSDSSPVPMTPSALAASTSTTSLSDAERVWCARDDSLDLLFVALGVLYPSSAKEVEAQYLEPTPEITRRRFERIFPDWLTEHPAIFEHVCRAAFAAR